MWRNILNEIQKEFTNYMSGHLHVCDGKRKCK